MTQRRRIVQRSSVHFFSLRHYLRRPIDLQVSSGDGRETDGRHRSRRQRRSGAGDGAIGWAGEGGSERGGERAGGRGSSIQRMVLACARDMEGTK